MREQDVDEVTEATVRERLNSFDQDKKDASSWEDVKQRIFAKMPSH